MIVKIVEVDCIVYCLLIEKAARKDVGEVVKFEKKAWPKQKKLAKKGIEFVKKGFEEAYGKDGLFKSSSTILERGTGPNDEYYESMGQPVRQPPAQPSRRMPATRSFDEEGPRDYMSEYLSNYEDEFFANAEFDGTSERSRHRSMPKSPMEKYLDAYEKKMARRGL